MDMEIQHHRAFLRQRPAFIQFSLFGSFCYVIRTFNRPVKPLESFLPAS